MKGARTQTYMNIRRLDPKIGSEMFDDSYAWVRIFLEIVLEAPDDMRSHLVALWDVLIRLKDGLLGTTGPVEDDCSGDAFLRTWQVVAACSCQSQRA